LTREISGAAVSGSAKALLGILIADLRVNSHNEVLPTNSVGTP
jgi:hypothetical protein